MQEVIDLEDFDAWEAEGLGGLGGMGILEFGFRDYGARLWVYGLVYVEGLGHIRWACSLGFTLLLRGGYVLTTGM